MAKSEKALILNYINKLQRLKANILVMRNEVLGYYAKYESDDYNTENFFKKEPGWFAKTILRRKPSEERVVKHKWRFKYPSKMFWWHVRFVNRMKKDQTTLDDKWGTKEMINWVDLDKSIISAKGRRDAIADIKDADKLKAGAKLFARNVTKLIDRTVKIIDAKIPAAQARLEELQEAA